MTNNLFIVVMFAGMIAVAFIFLGMTVVHFAGHYTRENIKFKNFSQKIKHFEEVLPNHIFGLAVGLITVNGIALLFVLFSRMAEFRPYRLSLGMTFVVGILTLVIWKALEYFNEDMTVYKVNYNKVTEAFKQKEKAEKSIKETKDYTSNIEGLIREFEQQIKTVEDPSKFNLKGSLAIIDQFVKQQTDTIDGYTDEVILKFNKALDVYFEQQIPTSITLPKINLDFKNQYDNVRTDIYQKYSEIFNNTLFTLIESKKYNTGTIITSGLQILKNNNYSPTQKLIELILISIDDIEGSPKTLVEYLVQKKIVELEELISYAINQKIQWVFKNNLFESQEQLGTISIRLIKEDAYNLALTFISSYFSRLKNSLAEMDKVTDVNKTIMLFHNYKKVMNIDNNYYSESKVLENKVLSVQEFFRGKRISDKLKNEIRDVSDLVNAYENRDKIDKLYEMVLTKYEDVKLLSIQALLMYSGIDEQEGLLDLIETSKLLKDLYNRILIKDLIIGTILLYALVMHRNDNEDLHNELLLILQSNKDIKKHLNGMNLQTSFESRKVLSSAIIKTTLIKSDFKSVSNIIIKTEKERLTLDKLAAIS